MSLKCQYSKCCKSYKSDSFNCNKEPEGCGNWRFIRAHQPLINSRKRIFLPFYVKYRPLLNAMILKLCLRLTKSQQEPKSSYAHESFAISKKPIHLTFLEKRKKIILSMIFSLCFKLSKTDEYKRR